MARASDGRSDGPRHSGWLSLLLAALLSTAIAACISPRWNRIEPGMSKADVIHFVGEPTRRTYDDDVTLGKAETWYYDYYNQQTKRAEPHVVKFSDEHVLVCQ